VVVFVAMCCVAPCAVLCCAVPLGLFGLLGQSTQLKFALSSVGLYAVLHQLCRAVLCCALLWTRSTCLSAMLCGVVLS
jgi:hypothetical protein